MNEFTVNTRKIKSPIKQNKRNEYIYLDLQVKTQFNLKGNTVSQYKVQFGGSINSSRNHFC